MIEKLGIVCNILEKRLADGDRFENLAKTFIRNGFKHIEIRDGEYLRSTEIGRFFEAIETAIDRYSGTQWKALCDSRGQLRNAVHLFDPRDEDLFHRVASFAEETAGAKFSYAMAHPWELKPASVEADNRIIIKALKLAYLLCPGSARLRLVDPELKDLVNPEKAISNLKRYRALADDCSVEFCIENALLPATTTLELALKGNARFVYDEANTYNTDGAALNPSEKFWNAIEIGMLTSVHIKQKSGAGVVPRIEEGFVDFRKILSRLRQGNYAGDLLLENAPTEYPLEDAVKSREYLLAISS